MIKRLALAAATLVVAAPLVTASPAVAAYGCGPYQFSDGRHTVAVHCDQPIQGTTQYAIAVHFCGPSGCWYGIGNFKNWGAAGKSTAHSDFGTANSVDITYR